LLKERKCRTESRIYLLLKVVGKEN